jgi:DNA-binding beta-propeller fold protein YncE
MRIAPTAGRFGEATVYGSRPSKGAVIPRAWLLCILGACTASESAVEPPEDQFFFPTAAATAPDDSVLFVTNGNSELRYDSGTVSVIDLNYADMVAANWTAAGTVPELCSGDTDHIETLICDEAQFMVPNSAARIGNFATDIAVQDTMNGTLRLIIPTRGDPSIAWVDWSGTALSCNADGQGFELCDDAHRLAYIHNNPDIGILPEEPFNVWASSGGEFAVVSHFTTGAVALINSPIGGTATVADVSIDAFEADPNTGLIGASGVAGRTSPSGDTVYVGARSEDRIQTYTVGRPVNDADAFLIPGNFFFLDAIGTQAGDSEDTRGMKFSPDGNTLYLINRDPPSLQIFDTSLTDTGYPANRAIAVADLCRDASSLQIVDSGDGDRVYVSCFDDGLLDVIDPRGGGVLLDQITTGSGPYGVAAAPSRNKLYVTNFLDDTIAVIDIAAGSPTRDRVVLRIGTVKPPVAPTSSTTPILF